MASKKDGQEIVEKTVAEKLASLADLQKVYSELDSIKKLRGELPQEVQDLEDEVVGMQTRLANLEDENKKQNAAISAEKGKITTATELKTKYSAQLDQVKNNREYDNLSKEIEFQDLEVQHSEKRIDELKQEVQARKALVATLKETIEGRKEDLKLKKKELEQIKSETKVQEEELRKQVEILEKDVDASLLNAFHRIRNGARNGLAVVGIQRGACTGCFNKIPPQRELDVMLHKKVIVCEYCGRILVDVSHTEEA